MQFLVPIAFLVLMGFVQGVFFYYVLKWDVRKFMIALVVTFCIIVSIVVQVFYQFRLELWQVYLILTILSILGANILVLLNKIINIYPNFRR